MVKSWVLIKDNIVHNIVKADQAFIEGISQQYDLVIAIEAIVGVVGIGYIRNDDGTFIPPELSTEEKELRRVQEIRSRIHYGNLVIEKFRARIPDEQALVILESVSPILQLLQFGLLKQAAVYFNSLENVEFFNELYSSSKPELGTIKEYFVTFLTAGVQ